MLARAVVNSARDAHPAFDKQSTSDAVALRRLASLQQGWLAEISRYKRDAVHAAQVIALPLDVFTDGVAIDTHLHVHGGSVQFTDTNRPDQELALVEYPLRLSTLWSWVPRGYIRARQLFLLDSAELWADVASVTLDLFPAGPDDLAPGDELMLPGQCQRACETALAQFMAGRASVSVPDDGAIESYLDEVTDRKRAKVSVIREVY